ncbi:primosomal protein N' [Catenuloplanes atrovinosus]|uniref:Probable replication restart protein PriA n=1 Tax=Catenuloplanes atrovinosus TaxID=137266 RepID=A0AAE4C787_9ACTN|nr:primosomal protein N' [Catenuloplanes atrovinosus]MDR7274286.1 primosomal protein N' (replication factor Y) [Catenuloplanes atrovinosus]
MGDESAELSLDGLTLTADAVGGGAAAARAVASRAAAPAGTPGRSRAPKPKPPREAAETLPVARVCVDVPLPHLDRAFDYLVPAELGETARPGTRVRVRFAGQLVDGWLLERVAESTHEGKLGFIDRLVSPERVLSDEVSHLVRAVAERYAGSLADVLRLAVPARHARAEQEPPRHIDDPGVRPEPAAAGDGWSAYPHGPGFLSALGERRAPRAVWSAVPGEDWPRRIAEAAAVTVAAGQGVVAVVPDARDLDRLDAALTGTLGPGRHATLAASLGPAKRYRAFLSALRGEVPVVIGTRAAAFAPVHALGLVVIWDDGDDSHAEPRAPYPHAREVLLTRAQLTGAAVLAGGFTRTAEAQLLVETGWAHELTGGREAIRARAPHVTPIGDDPQLARDPAAATARLPSLAWEAARSALRAGAPVLVQVPRRGYLPSVACVSCRTPARCAHCQGPLELRSSHAVPGCRWCGRVAADYTCPECGGHRLRASIIGARRTAEELGRAFPGTPVRTSGRDEVLLRVPAEPAVVVCTPGAEPVADGGYGAVLLLDTWALLTRADLRAAEEALRRWLTAAALARPHRDGGRVVVVADGGIPAVQALLRWDPAWYAARELAERRELAFPPASRMASLTGPPDAVADLLDTARLPDDAELLGPVPAADDQERMLVRVRRGAAVALARALHEAAGVRSARKAPHPVRVQIDPHDLF